MCSLMCHQMIGTIPCIFVDRIVSCIEAFQQISQLECSIQAGEGKHLDCFTFRFFLLSVCRSVARLGSAVLFFLFFLDAVDHVKNIFPRIMQQRIFIFRESIFRMDVFCGIGKIGKTGI